MTVLRPLILTLSKDDARLRRAPQEEGIGDLQVSVPFILRCEPKASLEGRTTLVQRISAIGILSP
jgi:hypothetical protein